MKLKELREIIDAELVIEIIDIKHLHLPIDEAYSLKLVTSGAPEAERISKYDNHKVEYVTITSDKQDSGQFMTIYIDKGENK